MEPLIYDPKTKPKRYAWLSFLKKFIFVPNQSNQVRQLRLLIFTTCLIMALVVGIDLFYTDNLIMSRNPISRAGIELQSAISRHRGRLDERESTPAQVTILRHGGHLDERESTRAKVTISRHGGRQDERESPRVKDTISRHREHMYEHESTPAQSQFHVTGWRLDRRESTHFKDTISRHRHMDEHESTPTQVTISQNGGRQDERESTRVKDTISRHGGHMDEHESTPAQVTISRNGGRLDERESTPAQVSLLLNILGPNQSDPVWQLRLLAALSLVVHATMGVLILPGDLQGVQATYQRVMLIMGFGVPIVVAVITLLVSIWLVPDPSRRSNWITGLSVANFSLLGGRLAVYWMIKRGTENILRDEES